MGRGKDIKGKKIRNQNKRVTDEEGIEKACSPPNKKRQKGRVEKCQKGVTNRLTPSSNLWL